MKIAIEISAKQIADLMVTAIEGNHMTRAWCNGVFLKRGGYAAHDGPWYANPALYEGAFEIEVEEILDESKHPLGKNLKRHNVGPAEIKEGFQLMAEKSPHHFADFIQENYDIVTADVWLQYCTLGEVVYG